MDLQYRYFSECGHWGLGGPKTRTFSGRPLSITPYSMSSAPLSLSPCLCLSPSSPAVKLWKEFGEGGGGIQTDRPTGRPDGVSQSDSSGVCIRPVRRYVQPSARNNLPGITDSKFARGPGKGFSAAKTISNWIK